MHKIPLSAVAVALLASVILNLVLLGFCISIYHEQRSQQAAQKQLQAQMLETRTFLSGQIAAAGSAPESDAGTTLDDLAQEIANARNDIETLQGTVGLEMAKMQKQMAGITSQMSTIAFRAPYN